MPSRNRQHLPLLQSSFLHRLAHSDGLSVRAALQQLAVSIQKRGKSLSTIRRVYPCHDHEASFACASGRRLPFCWCSAPSFRF
jgi:hypothetical protein